MADTVCDEKDVVLVIDDEAMIAEMIAGLVDDFGCAYESFSDPQKALRYYEENLPRITLLITDLMMPDLSGPDLIRKVSRINPALPVILATAYANQEIPADIPPLVRQIISKPFTRAELLTTVRAALAKGNSAP